MTSRSCSWPSFKVHSRQSSTLSGIDSLETDLETLQTTCGMLWRACRSISLLPSTRLSLRASSTLNVPRGERSVPLSDDASPPDAHDRAPLVVRHDRLLGYRSSYPPEDISRNDVQINGLVRSIRKQKQRAFASISDGSTLTPLQACLTPDQAKE